MLVIGDRIEETTATTGTGTITLAGATAQNQSFAAIGNGNSTYYGIKSGDGTNWETGIGTYTASGTTLSRTTILASSNAGAAISLTGTSTVFCGNPARIIDRSLLTYPAMDTSTTSIWGATVAPYLSGATIAVADGDAYKFRATIKRTGTGDTIAFLIANAAKDKGHQWSVQSDGNLVLYRYNAGSASLRASGASVPFSSGAGPTGWVVIEGQFSFGSSSNWLQWLGNGFPIMNTSINFVGDSFYVGVIAGASASVGSVQLQKINP